jgi:hypothetical protein
MKVRNRLCGSRPPSCAFVTSVRAASFLLWVLLVAAISIPVSGASDKAAATPPHLKQYFDKYTTSDASGRAPSPVQKWRGQLATNHPPSITKEDLTQDLFLTRGYLNLKRYAKGDGKTDDTRAIMEALYDAYHFHLALYVPAGTYLVSDTLDCYVNMEERFRDGNGFAVIGDPDNRPVIKLMDRAPLFQDPAKFKYVIDLRCSRGGPWLMNMGGVSSIVIDCGKENPGAIGLSSWSAQATYFENILVLAYGALAGIRDIPASAGYVANIEVRGGRYGIWINRTEPGAGVSGCTLIDQDDYALVQDSGCNPIFLAGFWIEKKRGPVALAGRNTWGKIPNLNAGGQLSLVDGVVVLREKSTAFANLEENKYGKGKDFYIKNVYVQNAETLVHSPGRGRIGPAGEWSRIREYACNAASSSRLIIDGREDIREVIDVIPGEPEGDASLKRHWLSRVEIPTGMDTDAVSIRDAAAMGKYAAQGDGTADDTAAFRHAVRHFRKIYLPRGTYRITGNVELRKETQLFGASSHNTYIIADISKWKDEGHTSLFSTVDDAGASCLISQVTVLPAITDPSWPDGQYILSQRTGRTGKEVVKGTWDNGWPLLDWKAGRKSVVKNFYPHSFWDRNMPDGPLIRISGNGGGRWHAFDAGGNVIELRKTRENFLHSVIEGTSEPLVIYQHAAIHGQMSYGNIIRNSRNVEIYGMFPEEKMAIHLLIEDSEKIFLTAIGNNATGDGGGKPLIEVRNSRDVTISCLGTKNGPSWARLKDDRGVLVPGTNNVSYYRISR